MPHDFSTHAHHTHVGPLQWMGFIAFVLLAITAAVLLAKWLTKQNEDTFNGYNK
jgi:hypothetical protein